MSYGSNPSTSRVLGEETTPPLSRTERDVRENNHAREYDLSTNNTEHMHLHTMLTMARSVCQSSHGKFK